jgi:histidinol-phosphate/aromatic aminotransferase/cobyric acid decarboxylase-like protein
VFAAASERKVLLARPSFPMYEIYCKSLGVDAIVHQLSSPVLDSEKFIEKISEDVGLIIIANPSSPFGEYLPLNVIEKIVSKAEGFGCKVIIDEAYIEFVSSIKRYQFPLRDNVVKVGTLSKAFGGAGARFGWAASSHENIHQLRTVSLTYPVSSVTYKFAEFVLKNIKQMQEYTTAVRRERHLLTKTLRSNGINILDTELNTVHVESSALFEDIMERFTRENDVLIKQRDTAATPITIPNSPNSKWYRFSTRTKRCRRYCSSNAVSRRSSYSSRICH